MLKLAKVAGNINKLEAKIGGIHARHVHLQRQVRGLSAVHASTHLATRVLNRDLALGTLEEHDHGDAREQHRKQHRDRQRLQVPGVTRVVVLDRLRDAADDAGQDDHRRAVADAALRRLLAQPHQQARAGGERDHGHQPEAPSPALITTSPKRPPPMVGVVHVLERERHARRLQDAEDDRAVTRVLLELASTRFALFAQLFDLLTDQAGELHDDARRDVGHDAQRQDRQIGERATREQVEQPEQTALALHDVLHHRTIDARDRDEHAQAVDREHDQREGDPAPELRHLTDIRKT